MGSGGLLCEVMVVPLAELLAVAGARMRGNKRLKYLNLYPVETGRWMNRCVACRRLGHKPEMPERIPPGFVAEKLRSLFQPLPLNERGLCEMCAAAGDAKKL